MMRILLLLVLLAFAGAASATDYYVATWGDNSDLGNLTHPWQNLTYADGIIGAGDTLYLFDGTWYDEHVLFVNSGNTTHPIVMIAYNGTPTLDGVTNLGNGILIENEYITICNLKIINYNTGINIFGAGEYANISNNNISVEEHALLIESNGTISHNNTLASTTGGCYRIAWAGENGGPWDVVSSNNSIIDSGWNGCVVEGFNITQYGEIVLSTPFHNSLQISTRQGTIEPQNCIYKSCQVYNSSDNGFYIPGRDAAGGLKDVLDVIVEDCTVNNTSSRGLVTDELTNITIRRYKSWDIGSQDVKFIDSDNCYIIDSELDMTSPSGYQDLSMTRSSNVKAINTKFYEQSVDTSDLMVYYYLDVLVLDANSDPVSGATVNVTNLSYNPINLHTTPRAYTEGHLDSRPITESLTGVDGHTPLPSDGDNTFAIADYRTNVSTVYYTYNVSVEYDGHSNSTTVNPESSWYRSSVNTYQNTTTVILSSYSGWAPSDQGNYWNSSSQIEITRNVTQNIFSRTPIRNDNNATSFKMVVTT